MDHLKRINNLLTFAAMKFWQRLLRYLIGFGLGCLLVFWMFPNHDWLGWLPEKQIRSNIRNSKIKFSERAQCIKEIQMITESDWQSLLENGDVNFDKSNIHQTLKNYWIENDLIQMKCEIQDSTTLIIELSRKGMTSPSQCEKQ
jgi:hypothetical protein